MIYDKSTNANGFVGYSAADDFIVVSFSGTDPLSIKNWIDDINTLKARALDHHWHRRLARWFFDQSIY